MREQHETRDAASDIAWDLQLIAQRITTLADLAVDLHAEALQNSQAANLYQEVASSSARVSELINRLPPYPRTCVGGWRSKPR